MSFNRNFTGPIINTATQQVGNVINNITQNVVNHNFASTGQRVAESVQRMLNGGEISDFSNAIRGIGIEQQDGYYVALDEMTQQGIDIFGVTPQQTTLPTFGIASRLTPPVALVDKVTADENRTNELKVILKAEPGGDFGAGEDGNFDEIVLKVMPRISESRSVIYEQFTPIHHPGVIQKYKGTDARKWGISAKLVSRTSLEAWENLIYLNLIRSWAMPFYGEGTAASIAGKYLGAPPPIITLSAYGSKMIGPVKTILTDYSWDFPNDIDYIHTPKKEPFPVIIDLTINLTEAWSPAEYSGFNIIQYRNGNLGGNLAAFRSLPRARVQNPRNQINTPPIVQQERRVVNMSETNKASRAQNQGNPVQNFIRAGKEFVHGVLQGIDNINWGERRQ